MPGKSEVPPGPFYTLSRAELNPQRAPMACALNHGLHAQHALAQGLPPQARIGVGRCRPLRPPLPPNSALLYRQSIATCPLAPVRRLTLATPCTGRAAKRGAAPVGCVLNAYSYGPLSRLPAGLSGVGTGISGSASDLLGGDVTSADEHSHSASSVATAAAAALASGAAAGPTGGDGGGGALTPSPPAGSDAASYQAHQSALQLAAGLAAAPGGGAAGAGAVAVVVDSEATGYLMMGALSPGRGVWIYVPSLRCLLTMLLLCLSRLLHFLRVLSHQLSTHWAGLKRHSVTLFEGGRVAGDDVMRELVDELWASYAAGTAAGSPPYMAHKACYLPV